MKEIDGSRLEKMNKEMNLFIKKIIDEYEPSYTEVFTMLWIANEIMHTEMHQYLFKEMLDVKKSMDMFYPDKTVDDDAGKAWDPNSKKWDPEELK